MKTLILRSCAAALFLVFLAGCTPHSTGPTEVGVRTRKISPFGLFGKKGVEDKVYGPGSTYFFVPLINDWHTFDTRLFNLEMMASQERGDRPSRDDIVFKTIDGNDLSLDVIISYRVDPTKAPMILQEVATTDDDLKENIVRTVARSKPRDIFGGLNTEDFYVADKRTQKAEEAKAVLNEILAPYGVIVERVGTRDYRFNPAYQRAIEEKKVADQKAAKLRSETKAVKEEYLMKVEQARGDIAKLKAKADGEFERAKIEADAYYKQQEQLAQAIEAEGRAEAEGIAKMNEALSGPGGMAMVKMDLAEAMKGKRIVMLPFGQGGLDVRTTDVNNLLQLYGIRKLTEPAQHAEPASAEPATTEEPKPAEAAAVSPPPARQQIPQYPFKRNR